MAGNIKGITVEIGGNTGPLDTALKGVNKTARDLQGELREANKGLKLDPTNTTLLTQKQKLLAESVTNTKGKLETLKQAEKQAQEQFKQGKVSEEQYRKLQREVIKTEEQLKTLEKQAGKSNVTLSKISTATGKIGDGAGKVAGEMAPVTLAIGAMGGAATKMGSDFVESTNKVEVAFKGNAKEVEAWSKTTLDKFGIASGSALDMASLFGDMGTSMGLTTKEASNMSMSLGGLSGDLASFKNINIKEAETALNGVFTGETESLKKLGIVMTEQNLLQWAVSKGMIKNKTDAIDAQRTTLETEKAQKSLNESIKKYGENSIQARDGKLKLAEIEEKANKGAKVSLDNLSQAEKVQLRYNYVIDKTKNAQGDFAKTSGGAANSTRMASEAAKEASASIGVILAPMVAKAAQYVAGLAKNFAGLSEDTKKTILVILAIIAVIAPIAKLVQGITMVVKGLTVALTFLMAHPIVLIIVAIVAALVLLVIGIKHLWDTNEGFRNFINAMWKGIKDLFVGVLVPYFKGLVGIFTGIFGSILGSITSVFGNIKNIFNDIISFVKNVFTGNWKGAWGNVVDVFKNIIGGIATIFKAPLNAMIAGINGFLGGISKIKIPDWVPGIGGKGFNIPKIPSFDIGSRYLPQDMLIQAHKGEMIVPESENPYANSGGKVLGSSNKGEPVYVILNIDGKEFANATAPYISNKIVLDIKGRR